MSHDVTWSGTHATCSHALHHHARRSHANQAERWRFEPKLSASGGKAHAVPMHKLSISVSSGPPSNVRAMIWLDDAQLAPHTRLFYFCCQTNATDNAGPHHSGFFNRLMSTVSNSTPFSSSAIHTCTLCHAGCCTGQVDVPDFGGSRGRSRRAVQAGLTHLQCHSVQSTTCCRSMS